MNQLNRISSLPLAEYCGLAPRLAKEHGGNRFSVQSKYHHAKAAGLTEEADRLSFQLYDKELQEVEKYKIPGALYLDGLELHYEDAVKEVEVGLEFGDRASLGHPDMFWYVRAGGGLVVVGDIKRSEGTSDVDSLQMHGYGHALCAQLGAKRYTLVHFIARLGEWVWCQEYYQPGGRIKRRLQMAAENRGEAITGPHCHSCWQRIHCKEWLTPPDTAIVSNPVHNDQAHDLLDHAKRLEDLAKHAMETVRAYAMQNGGIHKDGKVWKRVKRKNPGRPGHHHVFTWVTDKR